VPTRYTGSGSGSGAGVKPPDPAPNEPVDPKKPEEPKPEEKPLPPPALPPPPPLEPPLFPPPLEGLSSGGAWATCGSSCAKYSPATRLERLGLTAVPAITPKPRARAAKSPAMDIGIGSGHPPERRAGGGPPEGR
jgi:hypothetical protein